MQLLRSTTIVLVLLSATAICATCTLLAQFRARCHLFFRQTGPPGYTSGGGTCVQCPSGTYKATTGNATCDVRNTMSIKNKFALLFPTELPRWHVWQLDWTDLGRVFWRLPCRILLQRGLLSACAVLGAVVQLGRRVVVY